MIDGWMNGAVISGTGWISTEHGGSTGLTAAGSDLLKYLASAKVVRSLCFWMKVHF